MRLYVTAWVQLDGQEQPFQVHKDRNNAAIFNVGDWQYDIDARPMRTSPDAPRIVKILSLQDARELGLRQDYNRDISIGI